MAKTDTTRGLAALLLTSALCAPALAQDTASSPMGPSLVQAPSEAETAVEDEVVVVGRFIPNEKRITSEITSVLDEDVFAEIGAGDIASALTRVTGLSLSQGRFVIVRGLNERYSSATLNGSPLPSPEPLRRVAPLDLFPTSVLSDVTVQKTYSPEFSGEFGGGSIALSTKGLPDEAFLTVGMSTSANTETTLRPGLIYEGSDGDWLGFDDGLRDLPALDADGVPTANFENRDTLLIEQQTNIPFNGGARITGGNRFNLDNGMSIGVLATVGYDNGWQTRRGENNTANIGAGNALVILDDGFDVSTQNDIALNGLLTVGVGFDADHDIQLVGLATRQSTAEARTLTGVDREDRIFRQDFTEWFEREVYLGQLLGTHSFAVADNDAEVSWRATYAVAGRDAPYERRVNYEDFEDGRGFRFQFNRPGTNNDIRFSELDDETLDLGVDVALPFDVGSVPVELKLGAAYLDKSRDSEQADFRYFGTIPVELRGSRIDQIFSDPVVDAGILEIRRGGTTGFPDLSEAGLEVVGGYAGADVAVSEALRFNIGGRFESSEQTTAIAQATVDDSRFAFEPLEENFFLPAGTMTWTFAPNWQLRLAASQTINRPQFRELTPSIFVNTDTDDRFVGNPFLTNSESVNLDARLEYYFGASQFVTVGGFYKDLTDPIEEFIFNGLGESNATSFLNAPAAELYGLEIEFEKDFRLDEGVFASVFGTGNESRNLVLRSNYTYTDSSVSADGDVFITPPTVDPTRGVAPIVIGAAGLYTDGRKLQGQSDHLANLQIGIEDLDAGWDAFVLLNYTSERIRAVEDRSNGLPSIIEQLPLSLDVVTNIPVEIGGRDVEFGFKVTNILGEDYEAFQELGDSKIVTDSYEIGTTFAASVKATF